MLLCLATCSACAAGDYVRIPIISVETFQREELLLNCYSVFNVKSRKGSYADNEFLSTVRVCDYVNTKNKCWDYLSPWPFEKIADRIDSECTLQ